MLQTLREHAQGWIAGIIVGILCLAFALWGIQYYLDGNSATDSVAKVNGFKITQQALTDAYQRVRNQQANLGVSAPLDANAQAALKGQILEQLITQEVLAQGAKKAGYRISPEQLQSVLLEIPAFQINGQFSPDLFQRALGVLNFTEQQFFDNLDKNMLITQAQSAITDSTFTLPGEVDESIRLTEQQRDLSYLIIPAAHFLRNTKVSEEAIKQYYDAHQKDFMLPEAVSIQYIELSAAQLAAQSNVTLQEAKDYYQNNQSQFTSSPEWKIAHILIKLPANADQKAIDVAQTQINTIAQKLQQGSDFAHLAAQFSQDAATAKTGGDLGWLSRNQQNPLLVQIASSLKVGQVSAPFKTADGFTIIKLLDVKQPQVTPFSQVQAQIIKTLQQQKTEQVFSDAADKLTNLTYTNPDTLSVAARALNLSIQKTPLFTRDGAKTGIIANPKILAAAFSNNVLQGNNSDVIQLDDNTLMVLRLNQHQAAKVRPLTEVHDQIAGTLKLAYAQQQGKVLADKILSQFEKGMAPTEIAKQQNLTWITKANVERNAAGISPQILSTAFGLPHTSSEQKPVMASVALPNGDYGIVLVTHVQDGDPNKVNAQQRKVMNSELENNWSELDYHLYKSELMQKASIKRK